MMFFCPFLLHLYFSFSHSSLSWTFLTLLAFIFAIFSFDYSVLITKLCHLRCSFPPLFVCRLGLLVPTHIWPRAFSCFLIGDPFLALFVLVTFVLTVFWLFLVLEVVHFSVAFFHEKLSLWNLALCTSFWNDKKIVFFFFYEISEKSRFFKYIFLLSFLAT